MRKTAAGEEAVEKPVIALDEEAKIFLHVAPCLERVQDLLEPFVVFGHPDLEGCPQEYHYGLAISRIAAST